MAQKLLSETPLIKLHIALFLLIAIIGLGNQSIAQTVLEPGDIVAVSLNADTNAVDIMPLIDIEEGTTLYLSDGRWNDSTETLSGNEVVLTTRSPIQAGTNLSLLAGQDSLFSVSGNLSYEDAPYHLFVYQKTEETPKFVYSAGWGAEQVWNSDSVQVSKASDIPGDLELNPDTFLSLNEKPNQQYYIRNGASGTKNMLSSFLGNESNWRGSETVFKPLGISFNILEGPVVQFNNTISSVRENDSTATVEIAIFEHNGSRLSVNLMLDTLRSTATAQDFDGFRNTTVNFTGIVGNYVHEVEIPVQDDSVFNNRKIGIFSLQNLTAGSFGDFRSHNLIVEDNEKPNVIISRVASASSDDGNMYVEITNLELVPLSLSEWSLETNGESYTINENIVLPPGQSFRWYDKKESENPSAKGINIYSATDVEFLTKVGGIVALKNHKGRTIHQVKYSKNTNEASKAETLNTGLVTNEIPENQQIQNAESLGEVVTAFELSTPGWKVLPKWEGAETVFNEKEFYTWNEATQQFEDLQNTSDGMMIGYFEEGEFDELQAQASEALSKEMGSQNLEFSLSATDKNENGVIDELEGLNLVFNSLDQELHVGKLVSEIETKYDRLKVHPVVYEVELGSKGALTFDALKSDQTISSNTPFWIMLNTEVQNVHLQLEATSLKVEAGSQENRLQEQKQSHIKLTLSAEGSSKSVQINLSEEGDIKRIRDLNSYKQLQLPNQDFLQFSFKQSAEFFGEINLPININQPVQTPIYFGGVEDEEFSISISDWGIVPDGWNIILKDLYTDKEYTLSENFTLEFKHSFTSANDETVGENGFLINQNREDERFVLVAIPEGALADEEDQEVSDKPEEIELYQNYPNPFNPATTISFYLPESQEVKLSVFNIVGQPVSVIVEGTLSAGQKQFEWDATDKPSGMYIYQLEVGNRIMTRKMTLVK
ncbi:lamin tail domain-containing protein [Gracilimonas sp.]|uniref:lamin tail domain-containing protein n=1 Tax=Gracilimonas sp. TaxID=1974203 RepID=UPI002872A198|nr:lamin tail domain-containing protein [Gracilimonas sp.]